MICIICHHVLSLPSGHESSSIGKYLLAKGHIAKLNEITESEVTKMTSLTVDETALAILKGQGSRGITIVSLRTKFIFNISVESILTELTDKTLQAGSKELSNSSFSPRHQVLPPHFKIHFWSYYRELNIEPRGTTVIHWVRMRAGPTIHQHPSHHLQEGIHTDSGCNSKSIAINKWIYFGYRWEDIDRQITHNIGHCLLSRSNLGIAWWATHIQ